MIIVTVELKSAIHPSRDKVLGRMEIINDGTSDNFNHGNYDYAIYRKPDFRLITRQGRLRNWPRNAKTIWHMIGAILKYERYE